LRVALDKAKIRILIFYLIEKEPKPCNLALSYIVYLIGTEMLFGG
jgi:hypothetical protein